MHICFINLIIEYYSPTKGGALATVIMQQGRHLLERGYQVSVLTRVGDEPTYDVGTVVPVLRLERHELTMTQRVASKILRAVHQFDWPYYEHYLRSVQTALTRIKPDIVICTNDLGLPRHVRRILPHVKVVAYLHNEIHTSTTPQKLVQSMNATICVSSYIRDWAVKNHQLPASKTFAILNGTDLEGFRPSADCLAPEPTLRVLFVGRIIPEKGPDLVIHAVRQLHKEKINVELTVVGAKWWHGEHQEDPYVREIRNMTESVGGRFTGYVPRYGIAQIFASHDVLMMPSRWNEPCGLVQLEAMASGCAAIVSDRGGIAEACGGAAILCDPDQPDTFVEALRQLALDRHTLNVWKQKSLLRSQELTWAKNVDRLQEILALISSN